MTYSKRFFNYLKTENKLFVLLIFVFSSSSIVLAVIVPRMQSALVEYVSDGYFSLDKFFTVFAVSILSIIILSISSTLPSILMMRYETKEKLSIISSVKFIFPSFLNEVGPSGLYYGACSIANDLSFIAYPALLNIFLTSIQTMVVLYFLFKISSTILYLTLLIWTSYLLIIFIAGKKYKNYISLLRDLKPVLSEQLSTIITKTGTISRFGNKMKFIKEYINKLETYNKINEKAEHFMQIQSILLTYFQGFCFASFILVSLPNIYSGSLTKGMLIVVLSYIPLLIMPLSKVQYFLKIKKWIAESEVNKEELNEQCKNHLSSSDLCFSYNAEKNLDVKKVCFSYKANEGECNCEK